MIPIRTFQAQFGVERVGNIVIKPERPEHMKQALLEIREILGAKYGFDPKDEPVLGIWDTVETGRMFDNMILGIEIFLGIIGGPDALRGVASVWRTSCTRSSRSAHGRSE